MMMNLTALRKEFCIEDPTNEKRDLEWVRKHSVVIRYFGRSKPWEKNYHGILDVFYHENNQMQ